MALTILDILDLPDPIIAVVGANDNPTKFGYAIYRELKRKGYRVIPVNPNRTAVDGDDCYARLADLPARPDIVNLVIPSEAAKDVALECLALGWRNVWLQPGTESPELLKFLEGNQFNYLARACLMLETRSRKA